MNEQIQLGRPAWSPDFKAGGVARDPEVARLRSELADIRATVRGVVERGRVCLTLPGAVAIDDCDMATLREIAGIGRGKGR